jgi:hypothetical protein
MSLEFAVKQIMGEIKMPKESPKQVIIEKKEPIVYKCFAHIMNNGLVGLNRKNKTNDEDKNLLLIFDGNTKELIKAEIIEQIQKEKIYDSSKFVVGL